MTTRERVQAYFPIDYTAQGMADWNDAEVELWAVWLAELPSRVFEQLRETFIELFARLNESLATLTKEMTRLAPGLDQSTRRKPTTAEERRTLRRAALKIARQPGSIGRLV